MKTVISGHVTATDLEDAGLMAGIYPSSLLVTDVQPAPALGLPVHVEPICKMRDREGAILARDYTLCQQADAVICRGQNEHLLQVARTYGLPVYEV